MSYPPPESQPLLYPRRRSASISFTGASNIGGTASEPGHSGSGEEGTSPVLGYQVTPRTGEHVLQFPASLNTLSMLGDYASPASGYQQGGSVLIPTPNLSRSKTYSGGGAHAQRAQGFARDYPALVERPGPQKMPMPTSPAREREEGIGDMGRGHRHVHGIFDEIEDIHLDWDPDFDTSAAHLMKLFNTLDKDKDGRITYDELREGLLSMRGMHEIPVVKINAIIQAIDTDHSHDITQDEFVWAFQHLATKGWRGSLTNLEEFFVYDYGPDVAICRWIYSKGQGEGVMDEAQLERNLDTFFLDDMVDDVKPGNVRWVSITGVDPSLIVRLANKYNLRMLQVEDVLGTDKERMKVDWSGKTLQIVLGRCTVLEPLPGCPQIKKEQVSVFLVGDHTVLSIQHTPSQINSLLLARIMYAGSKIRLNGPKFLVYSIIDSIVDELFPILRMLRKRLKALHSDVTSMNKTSLSTVHLIQHLLREIKLLGLWLSPLSAVASRLIAELPGEGTDVELKRHLDDLQDHIQALKEQTASMVDWAKSLNDEYLNEQSHRMNQVIYILTLVTIMVLPAQFFTGVFGMNFVYLPLLKDENGFWYFWGLTLTVSATIFFVFRVKSWL